MRLRLILGSNSRQLSSPSTSSSIQLRFSARAASSASSNSSARNHTTPPLVRAAKMNSLRTLRPKRVSSAFKASSSLLPRRLESTSAHEYEHLIVTTPKPGVAMIQLNRPKSLNALSTPLIKSLNTCLHNLSTTPETRAIVLTGSAKAFAAGADIKEMAPLSFATAYSTDFIESWSQLTTTLKLPLIAAVSGYALGGGCELAMMADILYATETATFGQPEIKLGTIPGAGGSQRLTRAIGKSKAMELILTGRNFSGAEAERWGLVARTFSSYEELVEGAVETAATIAGYSRVAVKAAKEVVNKSQEAASLREGVEYERKLFHGLFGSRDQKIGMEAFARKEKAEWVDE